MQVQPGMAVTRTRLDGTPVVDMPPGEQLPNGPRRAPPQPVRPRRPGRMSRLQVQVQPGMAVTRTRLDGTPVVDMPPGEQLPRIC